MANNTAGAPGDGAGFCAAVNGQKTYSDILIFSPHGGCDVSVLRVSPDVELFLGCFGAVYWNDSFP